MWKFHCPFYFTHLLFSHFSTETSNFHPITKNFSVFRDLPDLSHKLWRFSEQLKCFISAYKVSKPFSLINSGADTVNTILLQHRTVTREECLLTFNKRSFKILRALQERQGEVIAEYSCKQIRLFFKRHLIPFI